MGPKRRMKDQKQKGKKRRKDNGDDLEEQRRLERLILGDPEIHDEDSGHETEPERSSPLLPVWTDDDDSAISVSEARSIPRHRPRYLPDAGDYSTELETQFVRTFGQPQWAKLTVGPKGGDKDEDTIVAEDLLSSDKPSFIPPGLLECARGKSLSAERGPGAVRGLQFHPQIPVAMVAGSSGNLAFYQVDGKGNARVQGVHLESFPISCSRLSPDGSKVLSCSTQQRYLMIYDVLTNKITKSPWSRHIDQACPKSLLYSPCGGVVSVLGNGGMVHLLSATSYQYITTLAHNGGATAMAFNGDGSQLYTHGASGHIQIWDMNSRHCTKVMVDEGCVSGNSLALSSNGMLATGCSTGVVNVYSGEERTCPHALPHLVTPAASLAFNNTGELLAMASGHKENAVKLVHCSSLTVYSNFPTHYGSVSRPHALAFSPHSGYLGIGNQNGIAHIFRLKYYDDY